MRGSARTSREPGAMELVDVGTSKPMPNEVLIEVDYTGLCGSDAEIYEFKSAFERVEMSTIISHEYTGRVVECGEEASRLSVDERVVERPIHGCSEYFQYQISEENICQNAVPTGIDLDGAYSGYIAVPESTLQSVLSNVRPKHVVLVEPTAICARAVIQSSRVKAGDRMLVADPSPIGLLCAQVAASQDVEVVVASVGRDTNYRLPLAEELGYPAVNVEEDGLSATQCELTGGVDFGVVFDTVGHPSGLPIAVRQVRKDGQIVFVGQTGEITMEFTPLVRAEVNLQCTYGATFEDFEWVLRLIGLDDMDHAAFLDDRYRLTESEDASGAFLAGETCKPVFDVPVLRE